MASSMASSMVSSMDSSLGEWRYVLVHPPSDLDNRNPIEVAIKHQTTHSSSDEKRFVLVHPSNSLKGREHLRA